MLNYKSWYAYSKHYVLANDLQVIANCQQIEFIWFCYAVLDRLQITQLIITFVY